MLELILVLFIAIFLAWCLSKYLSKVMANQPMWGDGLFRWIENPVYSLLGVSPQQQMNWKQYSLAFVVSCILWGCKSLLNDGPSFGCCDLKAFFYQRKPYCGRCCRAARSNFNGNYWADVIRPQSAFASTLFCLVIIA